MKTWFNGSLSYTTDVLQPGGISENCILQSVQGIVSFIRSFFTGFLNTLHFPLDYDCFIFFYFLCMFQFQICNLFRLPQEKFIHTNLNTHSVTQAQTKLNKRAGPAYIGDVSENGIGMKLVLPN